PPDVRRGVAVLRSRRIRRGGTRVLLHVRRGLRVARRRGHGLRGAGDADDGGHAARSTAPPRATGAARARDDGPRGARRDRPRVSGGGVPDASGGHLAPRDARGAAHTVAAKLRSKRRRTAVTPVPPLPRLIVDPTRRRGREPSASRLAHLLVLG